MTLDAVELVDGGTYTLIACDQAGDETGDCSVHLQRTNDPAGAIVGCVMTGVGGVGAD